MTQPRVAFLLLAYNQAGLVKESALAALAQDSEPLDIVFSDDASTDDTFAVLQAVATTYKGPHRLTVRRNEKNLGIGEHWNTLIAASSCDLLIASAGDDISLPNRARSLIEAWENTQQRADLITSQCIHMYYDGRLGPQIHTDKLDGMTPTEWLAKQPHIVGATHAFTRRLHQHFGPFIPGMVNEDQVTVFRALCLGGAITLDKALVHYREGGISSKPQRLTMDEKRRWKNKKLRLEIIEAQQVLHDARIAGHEALVQACYQIPLRRKTFLLDLNNQSSLLSLLRTAAQHSGLPWYWRYQKAIAAAFGRY
ncbi:glycosyltransferase family 2 protein [Chitinimonas sp. PSY-7]|uniref:glycosyltransferase n=1 Tax=Chitinimonas sp. PSY-7 TaxID=3459088 RepID=UPI00403FF7C5